MILLLIAVKSGGTNNVLAEDGEKVKEREKTQKDRNGKGAIDRLNKLVLRTRL